MPPILNKHSTKKLGLRKAADPRDRFHLLTPDRLVALRRGDARRGLSTARRKLPWHLGPHRDQGNTSQCTVYSYWQWKEGAPKVKQLGWTKKEAYKVYKAAQAIDEFRDDADDAGTSERAVLEVMRKEGKVGEYVWVPVQDMEEITQEYLVTRGMLLGAMPWFEDMFEPDKHGFVEPTGAFVGYHEVLLRWYYNKKHRKYADSYEWPNTWEPDWGDHGVFRMRPDVFRELVQRTGDLVSPLEPNEL